MIKKIIAFVRRKPTTENALRGMSKALDQLQEVVTHENTEIDRLDDVIETAASDRLDAFKRRDRASKVAERFADLLA
ncbi:hypothetical protein [Brucella pseudogrignonensis]|uniref:hypothetical protein n=1 Tax=Brucella pseudogrignonensis TaxID=419475 RepID=UPI000CFB7DE6|nr:hypothetical protein [Brucella pseudogrignonensis]MQP38735.1 hypothetical protein [Ochrobactrum sp. MYb237]PQZ43349.1 hypothetical protein CQ059_05305 [Brucella pseudogrignonensis]PRA43096.1 hypothetical protein CQ063_01790 [Brucella pseudogrignonensis]PRA72434.1 hypothetical protein CQ055_03790 [Brucella pseudogrignonensis]